MEAGADTNTSTVCQEITNKAYSTRNTPQQTTTLTTHGTRNTHAPHAPYATSTTHTKNTTQTSHATHVTNTTKHTNGGRTLHVQVTLIAAPALQNDLVADALQEFLEFRRAVFYEYGVRHCCEDTVLRGVGGKGAGRERYRYRTARVRVSVLSCRTVHQC